MFNVSFQFIIILISFTICSLVCYGQKSEKLVDKNKLSEYFQNEQYGDAIQYLLNQDVTVSSDINAINALGYSYYMSEKYKEAEQVYLKALSLDTLNFTANRFTALINNYFKNYDNQLFYYQRLLRIEPSNAILYKLTGDTYRLLQKSDSALLYYQQAYHRQPDNVKVASAYTDHLLKEKNYSTADSVVKIFLISDTLNMEMIKRAIRSFMSQKKMADASLFTNRWLIIDEIDPNISVSLAQANYSMKNYEACYKVCDILIKQDIKTEAILYYASQAKHQLKDYNNSNELLKECLNLAISKNTNVYYFSRADNFESLKQFKKAIMAYDTAYYLFQDPLAIYNIGRLYEQGLNNQDLAHKYYRRYLALAKPSNKDQQRVYAYVKEMLYTREKESKIRK